ncbi:hypothetical protein BC628DRAFT_1311072 [Trametes gibbosa]|nr:hypothetical protein BC628DRAFT_1311072 [Trametes gibbosa]
MTHTPPIDLAKAALHDKTLSPHAVAFKIVIQCRRTAQLAECDATISGLASVAYPDDTPGIQEFLESVWVTLLDIASEDPSSHLRLAEIIAEVQASGKEEADAWFLWHKPFDWADLPMWGLTNAEMMHWATLTPVDDERQVLRETDDALATSILSGDTPAEDTVETRAWARGRKHWLNYNAFRAKLYALGVYEDTHWPIVLVRDYIEPLSLPEEVWRAYELGIPTYPHELGMETAMTWLRVAGAQIFACDKIFGPKGNRTGWNPRTLGAPGISGGTWNGVDGYHPDRWRHWKDILKAIVKGEKGAWRPNVIEAAKLTVEAMDKVEEVHVRRLPA